MKPFPRNKAKIYCYPFTIVEHDSSRIQISLNLGSGSANGKIMLKSLERTVPYVKLCLHVS